jgi:hypothetical protein
MSEITCEGYFKSDSDLPCTHYLKGHFEEAGFCKRKESFRCIEAIKHYLPNFTQSAFKTFSQCNYKYLLSYIYGFRPHDHTLPDAIKAGTVWDAFKDAFYTNSDFDITPYIKRYQIKPQLQAKVEALTECYISLEVDAKQNFISAPETQKHIAWDCGDICVTGYLDAAFDDHIADDKCSSSPDFHIKLENIHMQMGTYLYYNENWKYVDMKVVRLPGLKTGKGVNSDESFESYRNRLIGDILKRPSYYFIGFNAKTRTYGKRFYRGEFDFDFIEQTYINVQKVMVHMIEDNSWYRNELACHVPTPCWFLPYKKSGVLSEELYQRMDVEEAVKGMR